MEVLKKMITENVGENSQVKEGDKILSFPEIIANVIFQCTQMYVLYHQRRAEAVIPERKLPGGLPMGVKMNYAIATAETYYAAVECLHGLLKPYMKANIGIDAKRYKEVDELAKRKKIPEFDRMSMLIRVYHEWFSRLLAFAQAKGFLPSEKLIPAQGKELMPDSLGGV